MKKTSPLEEKFLRQLKERGLVRGIQRELTFAPKRRFRFDFAWPKKKLAVEINGGIWLRRGGHSTGKGIENDLRKLQLARSLGWTVFSYSNKMIHDCSAVEEVEAWLKKN